MHVWRTPALESEVQWCEGKGAYWQWVVCRLQHTFSFLTMASHVKHMPVSRDIEGVSTEGPVDQLNVTVDQSVLTDSDVVQGGPWWEKKLAH